MVRKLIVITLVALAAAVGLSLFLPSQYTVRRSLTLDASPAEIFPLISDLPAWSAWDPMLRDNPTIRSTYGAGPSDGPKGSWERWTVAGGAGGRRVIKAVEPMRRVALDLAFDRDASIAEMELTLEPEGSQTRVTWILTGELGGAPIARWGGLLMDTRMGVQHERGLRNLAKAIPKRPPALPKP